MLQVSSTAGMSVGGWARINLDDPGDGSPAVKFCDTWCQAFLQNLLLLNLLLLPPNCFTGQLHSRHVSWRLGAHQP
jgi:hypothetical protein